MDQPTSFDTLLSPQARDLARKLLECADAGDHSIATAESCTGGLLSTLLTDLQGLSHRFECGFVVYSDDAKVQLLGVSRDLLDRDGAVSRSVAIAMAESAVARSAASIALSVTGFAGPGGDCDEEGLVHFAVAVDGAPTGHHEAHYGAIGRDGVRARALEEGLDLLLAAVHSR